MIEQVEVVAPFIGIYTKIQLITFEKGDQAGQKKVRLTSLNGDVKEMGYPRYVMSLYLKRILQEAEAVLIRDKEKEITPDNLHIVVRSSRKGKDTQYVSTTDCICQHCNAIVKVPNHKYKSSNTKRFFCDLICINAAKQKSKQLKRQEAAKIKLDQMRERKQYRDEKRIKLYGDTSTRVKVPAPNLNATSGMKDLFPMFGVGNKVPNPIIPYSEDIKTTFAGGVNIFQKAMHLMPDHIHRNIHF